MFTLEICITILVSFTILEDDGFTTYLSAYKILRGLPT
jgi:hypothetical protein